MTFWHLFCGWFLALVHVGCAPGVEDDRRHARALEEDSESAADSAPAQVVEAEDPPATRCGSAAAPALTATWSAAPAATDGATLETTMVAVDLANHTGADLVLHDIRIDGDASGVPFAAMLDSGPVGVAAGTSVQKHVDLAEHADLTDMPSAGSITLLARVSSADGALIEQGASEPLYFHPNGAGLEVYGVEALLATHAAGDVQGAAAADLEPGARVRRVIIFPASALAAKEG